MENNPIHNLLGTSIEKIRGMIDANTIIGTPIQAGDVTLIPVSKLSFGFGSGGGDYVSKNHKVGNEPSFGGGAGAGALVCPVAFLIIRGDSVKLLPVDSTSPTTLDRMIEMVPEVLEKITGFIEKQQEKKVEPTDDFAE